MRIFLAGGSGAIGRRLLPMLVRDGHTVFASTRSPAKAPELKSQGATALVVDVLSRDDIRRAVDLVQPEVVIHELTALSQVKSYRNLDRALAATNDLRTRGLDNLIAAAIEARAVRFVAQSYGGWPQGHDGPKVKSESEPLDAHPLPSTVQSLAAISHIETQVPALKEMTGIVLRYGQLYGPGTGLADGGATTHMVKSRRFPLIGSSKGVWSFIHVDDAASATVAALHHGPSGIYNVADDEPAEVSSWLPFLARTLGARPPYAISEWLGRLAAGESVMLQMTQACGLSNEKAKRLLHWHPHRASWRTGFREI